jgi:hypothetical protein
MIRFAKKRHRNSLIAIGTSLLISCSFAAAEEIGYQFEKVRTLSGPVGGESGNDLVVDSSGAVFVIGEHAGLDFDNDGVAELKSYGLVDPLIVESRPSGERKWVSAPGGPGYDMGEGIAPDQAGGAYVTGSFEQTMRFRRTGETIVSKGLRDGYLARYGSNSEAIWAKAIGGTAQDGMADVGSDAAGNVYVVGTVRGEIDIDGASRFTTAEAGLLVASFDASGALRWARVSAGQGDAFGGAIAVTPQGDVFVAGPYRRGDADLDNDGEADLPVAPENYDAFIARFDTNGALIWAKAVSGPDFESITGLAVAGNGDLLLTGEGGGLADFDGNGSPDVNEKGRARNRFLARYNGAGEFVWVRTFAVDVGWHLATNEAHILLSGAYVGPLDLDDDGTSDGRAYGDGKTEGFVAILADDGTVRQVLTIVGPDDDQARAAGFSPDNKALYVTGYIRQTADFNGDGAADAGVAESAISEFFFARYEEKNRDTH